ncbi:MAG TPA: MASE1 domain-containing protein [Candidatus Acidoferrum sp.]|nr:MASE1 domain-containing protein [Candidatus Acidoferrum sp.]
MSRSRFVKDAPTLAALILIYFICGKLGLKLASVNASATAVWPCTGVALAALLILGERVWPAILVGAFLVNLTTAGSVLTSMSIAGGNTLEAVAACYLLNRFAGGQRTFESAQSIFKFTLFACMFATAVSATIGVTTVEVAHLGQWPEYGAIWATWWLGNGVGAIVTTPLIVLWWQNPRADWTRRQLAELACLFLGLAVTGWAIFGGEFHAGLKDYPVEYLCIPFLVWAAYRFGRRKTATATFLLAGIATWGTVRGFGPFAREGQNTSLLLLQTFMGIMAVTHLVLAAEVTERRHAEEHIRELVVTDPLTGLANYRRLRVVLEGEIRRYGRTGKNFALIMIDLDGLKKINDEHGHLIGSEALCRLANVLRAHSRGIDTAARYGGDEFVLVLPETGSQAAQQVAERISERLRADQKQPPLTVSVGTAIYPQDGFSLEQLLGVADRALYQQKKARGQKQPVTS